MRFRTDARSASVRHIAGIDAEEAVGRTPANRRGGKEYDTDHEQDSRQDRPASPDGDDATECSETHDEEYYSGDEPNRSIEFANVPFHDEPDYVLRPHIIFYNIVNINQHKSAPYRLWGEITQPVPTNIKVSSPELTIDAEHTKNEFVYTL